MFTDSVWLQHLTSSWRGRLELSNDWNFGLFHTKQKLRVKKTWNIAFLIDSHSFLKLKSFSQHSMELKRSRYSFKISSCYFGRCYICFPSGSWQQHTRLSREPSRLNVDTSEKLAGSSGNAPFKNHEHQTRMLWYNSI